MSGGGGVFLSGWEAGGVSGHVGDGWGTMGWSGVVFGQQGVVGGFLCLERKFCCSGGRWGRGGWVLGGNRPPGWVAGVGVGVVFVSDPVAWGFGWVHAHWGYLLVLRGGLCILIGWALDDWEWAAFWGNGGGWEGRLGDRG